MLNINYCVCVPRIPNAYRYYIYAIHNIVFTFLNVYELTEKYINI